MFPSSSTVSFLVRPSASKSSSVLFTKAGDEAASVALWLSLIGLGLLVVLSFLIFTFLFCTGFSNCCSAKGSKREISVFLFPRSAVVLQAQRTRMTAIP